jgi:hypothetical protein
MINTLLYQVFIFGNLELVYSRRDIKAFKIKEFTNILKDSININLGNYWPWRFYRNIKYLFNCWDNSIFSEPIFLLELYDLVEEILIIAKTNNIDITKIKNIKDYQVPIALILLLKYIDDKTNFFLRFIEAPWDEKIRNNWKNKFETSFSFHRNSFLLCDYIISYNDNLWSPSWCINFLDEQMIIPFIDIYTDQYFINNKLKFNKYMINDIPNLYERIFFLKNNALLYYNNYIEKRINDLTKNIFYTFPYNLIYIDYYKLLNKIDNIYIPSILDKININKINIDVWLLAILPKYLTAYLLGFPIITCDIPSDKNFYPILNEIASDGIDNYREKIYKNNYQLIKLKSMGIECANNMEENKILDLTFNDISEYNIDDTLLFFNQGICHVFTYPEFDDLITNERNPYNRNNMPLFTSVLSSLKLKKKIRRHLNYRFLEVDLSGTMKENFQTLCKKIKIKPDLINKEYNYTNALLNIFFNANS